MKFIFLFSLALTFCTVSKSQNVTALKVGDQIPNIFLGNFLNKPLNQAKTSDFKGKLVIFDFWNIHCRNCIKSMPKMDSIQKKFNNKIQIIYVTKNNGYEVNKFFSRTKIKRPSVPFIVDDSVLNALFPHNGDPLDAWIDKEGYVYSITFDYCTTNFTVAKFLDGSNPTLSRRLDFGINDKYPLVSEQNGDILNLAESYSILIKGLNEYTTDGNSVFIKKDSFTKAITMIRAINTSILMLYNIAYKTELLNSEINIFNLRKNNRIILDVSDSSDFFAPYQDSSLVSWINKNLISYEIKTSKENASEIYHWMQDDLNKYLPYKAALEKRTIKCLILKNISREKLIAKAKPLHEISFIRYNKDGSITIQNMDVAALIVQLIYANANQNKPILDETNGCGKIDMVIHSNLSDIKSLNFELQQYGFSLIEEDRKINMLVIKNKNISK